MKTLRFLFVIALLGLPGVVHAQQVKVHYDHGVDFSRFKTYSWLEGEPSNNPVAHQQIVLAIDRQLMSKGLKRVEENGDLNVAYYASLGGNVNARMVEYTQGLDLSRWEGGFGETVKPTVGAMPMARVVLDLVNASAKKLVWRGTARNAFTPNQAHAQKRINSDIAKLLKRFPPHPSKAGAQKTR
jgi:hypothetical protein